MKTILTGDDHFNYLDLPRWFKYRIFDCEAVIEWSGTLLSFDSAQVYHSSLTSVQLILIGYRGKKEKRYPVIVDENWLVKWDVRFDNEFKFAPNDIEVDFFRKTLKIT